MHNDYLLAPNIIEIKREMLSKYKFLRSDFYNVPIGNVAKLVPNVLHYENLKLYLRLELRLKNIHRLLEFNQWQRLKPCLEFNTHTHAHAHKHTHTHTHTHTHVHKHKTIEAETKTSGAKDGKTLHKLMFNAV